MGGCPCFLSRLHVYPLNGNASPAHKIRPPPTTMQIRNLLSKPISSGCPNLPKPMSGRTRESVGQSPSVSSIYRHHAPCPKNASPAMSSATGFWYSPGISVARNGTIQFPSVQTGDDLTGRAAKLVHENCCKNTEKSERGRSWNPKLAVAVGTAIARRPPHRSRRAELPHRALALDHHGHPL